MWLQGGAKAVAERGERGWALPIGATLLAVRQLGLGGWQPSECLAIDNELQAWQSRGDLSTPQGALRSGPTCPCIILRFPSSSPLAMLCSSTLLAQERKNLKDGASY